MWEALKARVWEALAETRWRLYRLRNPLFSDEQLLEALRPRVRRRLAAGLSLGTLPVLMVAVVVALLWPGGEQSGGTATAKASGARVAVEEAAAPQRPPRSRPARRARPVRRNSARKRVSAPRRARRAAVVTPRSEMARRSGSAPRRARGAPDVDAAPDFASGPSVGRPHVSRGRLVVHRPRGERRSPGGVKQRAPVRRQDNRAEGGGRATAPPAPVAAPQQPPAAQASPGPETGSVSPPGAPAHDEPEWDDDDDDRGGWRGDHDRGGWHDYDGDDDDDDRGRGWRGGGHDDDRGDDD
jgi:hypothetical protein